MRWILRLRLPTGRSYGLSGLIGLLTYVIYGSLNDAWANPTLVAIALYMYLSIPWYSKVSNRVETGTGELTGLVTAGRPLGRFALSASRRSAKRSGLCIGNDFPALRGQSSENQIQEGGNHEKAFSSCSNGHSPVIRATGRGERRILL